MNTKTVFETRFHNNYHIMIIMLIDMKLYLLQQIISSVIFKETRGRIEKSRF